MEFAIVAVCPDVIPAVLATVNVATDPVPLVAVTGLEFMLAVGVTMTVVPVESPVPGAVVVKLEPVTFEIV